MATPMSAPALKVQHWGSPPQANSIVETGWVDESYKRWVSSQVFESKEFEAIDKLFAWPQATGQTHFFAQENCQALFLFVPSQHYHKWELTEAAVEFQGGVFPMDSIGFAMHNCGLR